MWSRLQSTASGLRPAVPFGADYCRGRYGTPSDCAGCRLRRLPRLLRGLSAPLVSWSLFRRLTKFARSQQKARARARARARA
eukprot:12671062-Alexandrium_andersonii.AAC.1